MEIRPEVFGYTTLSADSQRICTTTTQDYVENCLRNEFDYLIFDTITSHYRNHESRSWRGLDSGEVLRCRSNWFERARSTGININDLMDAWETEKTAKISKEDIDELL